MINVRPKPFTPWGGAGNWEVQSQLYGTGPVVGFMARVYFSLSYSFQHGYFLIHLMKRNRSASVWISFRGTCSVCCCTCCVFVRRAVQATSMPASWFTSPPRYVSVPLYTTYSACKMDLIIVPSLWLNIRDNIYKSLSILPGTHKAFNIIVSIIIIITSSSSSSSQPYCFVQNFRENIDSLRYL